MDCKADRFSGSIRAELFLDGDAANHGHYGVVILLSVAYKAIVLSKRLGIGSDVPVCEYVHFCSNVGRDLWSD